jgi:hypothetical protein
MGSNRWPDARRLEAWAGETRVNLLRTIALVVFYGNHLLNYYVFRDTTVTLHYHAAVSALAFMWGLGALLIYFALSRRWMPASLKYLVTAGDLTLISATLMASPDGPRSALVYLYFVVLAASPLRLSLPLIYFTTFGVWIAGFLVLGHHVLIRVGWDNYYAVGSVHAIPRIAQILFLLTTGAAGLFAGQVVRQAARLVRGYPVTVVEEAPQPGSTEESH